MHAVMPSPRSLDTNYLSGRLPAKLFSSSLPSLRRVEVRAQRAGAAASCVAEWAAVLCGCWFHAAARRLPDLCCRLLLPQLSYNQLTGPLPDSWADSQVWYAGSCSAASLQPLGSAHMQRGWPAL